MALIPIYEIGNIVTYRSVDKEKIKIFMICAHAQCNPTRPLSRCYLRSYLVKNTAGAHKESNTKCKNRMISLKR